jgi:hypothetical protein
VQLVQLVQLVLAARLDRLVLQALWVQPGRRALRVRSA